MDDVAVSASKAFTFFVESVGVRLRQALIARYGSQLGAEVTAEAFAYAWEHWDRIQGMANPAGYLYRVGQTSARRGIFRKAPDLPRPPINLDTAIWVEPALDGAMESLSPRQRSVVLLVRGYSWTITEVVIHAEYLIEAYGDSNISGMGGIAWLSEYQIFTKQEGAATLSEPRLANARRLQDHQALVPALGSAIELDRQMGEYSEAMLLVHEFEKATADRAFFRIQGLGYVTRFLEQVGEWDVLERLIEGLDADPEDPQATYRGDTAPTSYARGIVALGRGHLDVATEEFEIALTASIAAGSPWQRAMIVAHQAAVYIERGKSDAAAALLDQADELLQVLGGSVFDDYVAEQRARM